MLSILKKPEFQGTQKFDLKLSPSSPAFIPIEVITDGKLLKRNLLEVGKSREWLDSELKSTYKNNRRSILCRNSIER